MDIIRSKVTLSLGTGGGLDRRMAVLRDNATGWPSRPRGFLVVLTPESGHR